MKKAKVVLNEQHTLMDDQVKLLNEKFGEDGWEILPVPASGWTKEQMEEVLHKGEWGERLYHHDVVFASPVPYLLGKLVFHAAFDVGYNGYNRYRVFIFHNDHRDKKELPNGRVIQVVAKTGWELVEIV